MRNKDVNVLIIGNLMGSSPAFDLFSKYTFLYWSGRFNIFNRSFSKKNGIRFNPFFYKSQIRRIIKKKGINIIYFYTDQRMKIYNDFGIDIFETDFGVPKVFAFHNHHLLKGEREERVLKHADAYVFLNEESYQFYKTEFSLERPVFYIPSLYLPVFESYNISMLDKLSEADGQIHIGMGGRFVTCEVDDNGNCSETVHQVHRYDFSFIVRELSKRGIHSHIYGEFKGLPRSDVKGGTRIKSASSNSTKLAYERLAQNSSFIHLEGLTNTFEKDLSQYDYFICKGIIDGKDIPEFEHMNYQLRFNSALAAGLPVLVARDTDRTIEREINKYGGGIVYESFDDLADRLEKVESNKMSKEVMKLRNIHSFDNWLNPMLNFFNEVIEKSNH